MAGGYFSRGCGGGERIVALPVVVLNNDRQPFVRSAALRSVMAGASVRRPPRRPRDGPDSRAIMPGADGNQAKQTPRRLFFLFSLPAARVFSGFEGWEKKVIDDLPFKI